MNNYDVIRRSCVNLNLRKNLPHIRPLINSDAKPAYSLYRYIQTQIQISVESEYSKMRYMQIFQKPLESVFSKICPYI